MTLGVDCCITCGSKENLRPFFDKGLLKEKDDLYCPKHYGECVEWVRRALEVDK